MAAETACAANSSVNQLCLRIAEIGRQKTADWSERWQGVLTTEVQLLPITADVLAGDMCTEIDTRLSQVSVRPLEAFQQCSCRGATTCNSLLALLWLRSKP